MCFKDDNQAHLPLVWRFAISVFCTTHQCLLQDKCPHCQTPYAPHLLTTKSPSINYCATCLKKLDVAYQDFDALSSSLLIFQKQFENALLYHQHVNVLGQEMTHSEYIELVLFFIGFIRQAQRVKTQSTIGVMTKLGAEKTHLDTPFAKCVSFGAMTPKERLPIIAMLPILLNADTETWRSACVDYKANKNIFFFDKNTATPKLLESIYDDLIDKSHTKNKTTTTDKPKTLKQVKNRHELLKRKVFGVGNE